MKAREACELAYACGLHTTYEAYQNVLLHSSSLFEYDRMAEEVMELKAEIDIIGNKLICKVFPDIDKEERKWMNKRKNTLSN